LIRRGGALFWGGGVYRNDSGVHTTYRIISELKFQDTNRELNFILLYAAKK
jgi:hypothetical protein